jgi:D-alanine-D-alanine ligase
MNKINNKIIVTVDKEDAQRRDVSDTLKYKDSIEEVFLKSGFSAETLCLEKKDFENANNIKTRILSLNPFCIFNLFEGFSDDSEKEVEFVKILEEIGFPFTGNSSFTLGVCLNKVKTNEILKSNNIPVPASFFVSDLKNFEIDNLPFPVFVKPNFEDASLGIDTESLVYKKEDLYKVVEKKIKKFPKGILITEFISGKEYGASFMGNSSYELLGISVLNYSQYKDLPPFLTYSSKWESGSKEFSLLPSLEEKIDESLRESITDLSIRVGRILKCRSYFRVDLREKDGRLFVLDVNPNPDIDLDSGFMRAANSKGYTYKDTIKRIMKLALQ